MKKISLFLMLWSVASVPAWSHEAPVPINKMLWVVDDGHLRVHFHSGAPWWVLNVLGEESSPPLHWPTAMQKEVKTYFDQHFVLRADGKTLPSQWVAYRYSEEVWRYYLGSQLDLEFSYDLPSSVQVLSGQATFYKEENEGRHETRLQIDGAPPHSTVLTPAHPDFSFAFQAIVRSSARRRRDAGVEGLVFWQSVPWLALAFAAFQLQWRTRTGRAVYYGGLIGVAAMGAIFLDRGGHPGNLLSAGMTAYAVGIFISLLGIAIVIEMGLHVYRRRLRRVSESQADQLFTSQIRFVSLLLGGMTLLLLAQYVQHPS